MPARSQDLALALAALLAAAPPAAAETVDGAFDDVGPDTVVRFFHRASLLASGEVLVSGGMRLQLLPPSLISLEALSFYDPATATFSAGYTPPGGGPVTPALVVARSSHTQTTLLDGRVLFTGGRTGASGTSAGTPVASVELFDPASGAMAAGPAMAAARAGHTATRLADGRVVVAGGPAFQIFTPGADTWSAPVALVHPRTDHAAVRLDDGRVLLAGGSGGGGATLERIDPDAAASTASAATLAIAVDDLAAGRLDDGTVLVVGGQDLAAGDTVGDSYRYDPAADAIAAVPPPPGFPAGLADHQLVPAGRYAFVFGGEQQIAGMDTELACAAVFDRAAGGWRPLPPMSAVHDDFASATLADGRILLVDGGAPFLGQEVPTNVVERFTATNLRPPDLDGDAFVGFADLLEVLTAWGPCAGAACAADLDFDGAVGFGDVLVVLGAWGPCPG